MRRRLPWAMLLMSALLSAAGLVLLLMSLGPKVPPPAWGFRGFTLIFATTFACVGFVVARNRPDNAIGWLFLIGGVLSAVQFLTEQHANYAYYVNRAAPAGDIAAWVTGWIWIPIVGIIGIYLLLLFPNGHLHSKRWRPVVWLAPPAIALGSGVVAVSPGKLPNIGLPKPVRHAPSAFSARLRDEIDIDALTDELEDVVSRTMQPALVSLWMKREG